MLLGFVTKLVLSAGVGIASQIVVKDVLIKLVTIPSNAAMKAVYAVGISGIGLAVSHQVGDSVEKTYDAVVEVGSAIKNKMTKKKVS
jgi:predicted small secreted protein